MWCIQGKIFLRVLYVVGARRVACELSSNELCLFCCPVLYEVLRLPSSNNVRPVKLIMDDNDRAVLVVRPPTAVERPRHKPLVIFIALSFGALIAVALLVEFTPTSFAPILRDSRLSCFSWLHERNIGNARCQLPERQLESILSFLECVIDVASGGDLNSVVDDDVRAVSSACVESMQQCLLEPQCHDSARRIFDGVERDR